MMRTTIPTLLMASVFLFQSVESSSLASSSSGGSGSRLPHSVDGTPLGPDEQDIVHNGKILIKANFVSQVVIPFENSEPFVQYRPVEDQDPHHYEEFEPFAVEPDQWLADINSYATEHNNPWLYKSARRMWQQQMTSQISRRAERYQRELQIFRDRLRESVSNRRRRGQ